MAVRLHPHARQRIIERGASEEKVIQTVEAGEQFPAKYNRFGFRRNFAYNQTWRGRWYDNKQVEVIAVREHDDWLALTVIVRFF